MGQLAPFTGTPGRISIVFEASPVGDARFRRTQHIDITGPTYLRPLLEQNNLISYPARVFINGDPLLNGAIMERVVTGGEFVEVFAIAREPGTGAAIFAALEAAVGTAAATFISSVAYAVVLNLVATAIIKAISGGGNSGPEQRQTRKDAEGYGLSGGANQYRTGQPIPLVMGEHRIFPDYSNWWSVDYIDDYTDSIIVYDQTGSPKLISAVPPLFAFNNPSVAWETTAFGDVLAPWVPLDAQGVALIGTFPPAGVQGTWGLAGEVIYFVDQMAETIMTNLGNFPTPHRFLIRYTTPALGQPSTTGLFEIVPWIETQPQFAYKATIDYSSYVAGTAYDYFGGLVKVVPTPTQRFTGVYEYGLGDLALSSHHIGTTPVTDYASITITPPARTATAEDLPNWRHAPLVLSGALLNYPENVESVDGGEIKQNANVQNLGFILRRSTRKAATYIEIDLSGRLGKLIAGQYADSSVYIEIKYRPAPFTGVYIDAPQSAYIATNGVVGQAFRKTIGWSVAAGHYEVAVRKLTADPTNAGDFADMVFERVKFYETHVSALYTARNRVGVQVLATSQINGVLDRFSSLAQARTWVYTGAGTYDGTAPSHTNPNWTWTTSKNPAWWFMYFGAGGFLNSGLPAGHPTQSQGWCLGDAPAGGFSFNRQALFGGGLAWAQINVGAVVAWARWCVVNNLEQFGAVLDTLRPVDEVLDDIARVGRASRTWAGGTLGVVYLDVNDPVTSVVGMGNIVAGSFSVSYRSARTVDEIVATYNDSAAFYSSGSRSALIPGSTSRVRQTQLQLWGITDGARAQREVNLIAADQLYHPRVVSWSLSEEGSRVRRGDVVALAHDLTAWAFSGRVVGVTLSGGVVSALALSRAVYDPTGAAPYYVAIGLPDHTILNLQVAPPLVSTNVLTITGGTAWGAGAAPYSLGDDPNATNPLSAWPDSVPDDFTWLAGPLSTPGKRLRVLSVTPTADRVFQVTSTDEVSAYYSNEFAVVAPAGVEAAGVAPARAYNLTTERRSDGSYWLVWELERAPAAEVQVSLSGGSFGTLAGTLTTAGTELRLPGGAPGMGVVASVTPQPNLPLGYFVSDFYTGVL